MVADHHPLIREGLRAVLSRESDFWVVGDAGDGEETLRLVSDLRPDVLISDLLLPKIGGADLARLVRERSPRTRTVILTAFATEADVLDALRKGASAYVLKGAAPDELVRAVRLVLAGELYLSPGLGDRALADYLEMAGRPPRDWSRLLTAREREVLRLAAEGRTQQQIAMQLGISPRTVETHRQKLMRKLGLANQMELLRFALTHGLLPVPDHPDRVDIGPDPVHVGAVA